MQYFVDPANQQLYAFDDDVVVTATSTGLSFSTAKGVLLAIPATLKGATAPTPAPAATPGPAYVPASVVRERLQAVGLWDAIVALMSDAQRLWFATLQIGIDPTDTTVATLLSAVGANPTNILGPV